MATRGRGRGRGLLVGSYTNKPGLKEQQDQQQQQQENGSAVTVDDISTSLRSLDIEPDDDQILPACDLIKQYVTNESKMSEMSDLIYGMCFRDRDFALPAAKLINALQNIDVAGTKFRTSFLTLMQKDFQSKEKLRETSSGKFLSLVAFLCQMFGTVRLANGDPMLVLTSPVYQCLNMIAGDGKEEEIECLVYQLQGHGELLEEKTPKEMLKLMQKVRQAIVSHKTSARVRCMLLELLETWYNKWQPLPAATSSFYADLFSESLLQDS